LVTSSISLVSLSWSAFSLLSRSFDAQRRRPSVIAPKRAEVVLLVLVDASARDLDPSSNFSEA